MRYQDVPELGRRRVLTTLGDLVQDCEDNNDLGLVLVSYDDWETVVLLVDEVSDDETANLFLWSPAGPESFVPCTQMEDPTDDDPMHLEVLIPRG